MYCVTYLFLLELSTLSRLCLTGAGEAPPLLILIFPLSSLLAAAAAALGLADGGRVAPSLLVCTVGLLCTLLLLLLLLLLLSLTGASG